MHIYIYIFLFLFCIHIKTSYTTHYMNRSNLTYFNVLTSFPFILFEVLIAIIPILGIFMITSGDQAIRSSWLHQIFLLCQVIPPFYLLFYYICDYHTCILICVYLYLDTEYMLVCVFFFSLPLYKLYNCLKH